MNYKITFPELVTLLAEKSGLPKRQCEMFLKELFSSVSNTLIEGEGVKIKGLGTFKLTDIDSRKSIDVNTGREIEIPGHKRVSFTPSKSLADRINLPFASFDTVELNDGVTDEMLLAADSQSENIPESETEPETEPATDTTENTEEETVEEETVDVAEEETEEVAEDVTVDVADIPSVEDSSHAEDNEQPEPESADSIVSEIAAMETRWETTELEQQSSQAETNNNDITANAKVVEIKHTEINPKRSFFGWGFAAGILTCLCLAGIGLAVWYYSRENTAAVETDDKDNRTAIATATETSAKVTDTDSTAAKATEPAKVEKIEPEKQEQIAENKKSEVDTKPSDAPIYDTITRTRYLTTMAKEHYGSYHLWPYIYEANKSLGHPDKIRPGTKVKVPSLAKLGIDPKDPAVISAAKRKGRQIYSRYEKK